MTNRIKLSNIPSIYEATNSLRISNLSNECIVSKSNYQSAMENQYSNKDTIVDGPKSQSSAEKSKIFFLTLQMLVTYEFQFSRFILLYF